MYKVIYYLVDGTRVSVDLKCSEKEMGQFLTETRRTIQTDGTVQAEKRTLTGYHEDTIINAKNITKIECINLDDKVTEEDTTQNKQTEETKA